MGKTPWTESSPKRTHGWQVSTRKDAQHQTSSGNCKLKQWGTTTHLLAWPESETLTTLATGEGWSNRTSHSLLVGIQMVQSLHVTVGQFLTEKNSLTIQANNRIPCHYPNELKTYVCTKTWTQIFTIVLFIIAKTWKQVRCPSKGEWIHYGILSNKKKWPIKG